MKNKMLILLSMASFLTNAQATEDTTPQAPMTQIHKPSDYSVWESELSNALDPAIANAAYFNFTDRNSLFLRRVENLNTTEKDLLAQWREKCNTAEKLLVWLSKSSPTDPIYQVIKKIEPNPLNWMQLKALLSGRTSLKVSALSNTLYDKGSLIASQLNSVASAIAPGSASAINEATGTLIALAPVGYDKQCTQSLGYNTFQTARNFFGTSMVCLSDTVGEHYNYLLGLIEGLMARNFLELSDEECQILLKAAVKARLVIYGYIPTKGGYRAAEKSYSKINGKDIASVFTQILRTEEKFSKGLIIAAGNKQAVANLLEDFIWTLIDHMKRTNKSDISLLKMLHERRNAFIAERYNLSEADAHRFLSVFELDADAHHALAIPAAKRVAAFCPTGRGKLSANSQKKYDLSKEDLNALNKGPLSINGIEYSKGGNFEFSTFGEDKPVLERLSVEATEQAPSNQVYCSYANLGGTGRRKVFEVQAVIPDDQLARLSETTNEVSTQTEPN